MIYRINSQVRCAHCGRHFAKQFLVADSLLDDEPMPADALEDIVNSVINDLAPELCDDCAAAEDMNLFCEYLASKTFMEA